MTTTVPESEDPWFGQPVVAPVVERQVDPVIAARRQVADGLADHPDTCPAELNDWVIRGRWISYGERTDTIHTDPPVGHGARCAADADAHPDKCCWCNKFRDHRR